MAELAHVLGYLLSSLGLTVLLVWPRDGPGAWLRERVLRRVLPPAARAARAALDCYVCFSFWVGLGMSALWWCCLYRERWVWLGCLMVPGVFWLILDRGRGGGNGDGDDDGGQSYDDAR